MQDSNAQLGVPDGIGSPEGCRRLDSGRFVVGLLDGDGGFVFTDISHAVVTSNGNGVLICRVTGVANSSGQAVIWNFANTGLLCGTPAGTTDDWSETVSASGNASLRCFVHPS